MAKKTWTLTDVAEDVYEEVFVLSPEDLGGGEGYAVTKSRLWGGLRDGVDLVHVDNGALQFDVLPTRGMGIWRAALGELMIGWKSPLAGPVHPAFVNLAEPNGLGWLAGFDELLVRCGLQSNGAVDFDPQGRLRYGLHGRIANLPAHKVQVTIDDDQGYIEITGTVDEARLFGNKLRLVSTVRTPLDAASLSITDVVTNLSAEPGELQMLYHFNVGMPLVAPGSKVVVPVRRMAPRDAVAVQTLPQWSVYPPESPGKREAVFFFDLAADAAGHTMALLCDPAGQRGVSLRFNKTQLPHFILWKNYQAAADGYVTGLEPATNFPNPKSFEKEKGRVITLAPGESRTFELTMEVYPHAESVRAAIAAIEALQGGAPPTIEPQPDPEWSV